MSSRGTTGGIQPDLTVAIWSPARDIVAHVIVGEVKWDVPFDAHDLDKLETGRRKWSRKGKAAGGDSMLLKVRASSFEALPIGE